MSKKISVSSWKEEDGKTVKAEEETQRPWCKSSGGETESRETSQGWIVPTVLGYENEFGLWFVLPLLLTNSGTKAQWLVQCHWNTGWFWKWDGLASLQLFCFIELLAESGVRWFDVEKIDYDTVLEIFGEETAKKFLQESLFWNRERAGKFTEQHSRPFPLTVPEYTPF